MVVGVIVDLVIGLGEDVDAAVGLALKGAIDAIGDVGVCRAGVGAVIGQGSVGPVLARDTASLHAA